MNLALGLGIVGFFAAAPVFISSLLPRFMAIVCGVLLALWFFVLVMLPFVARKRRASDVAGFSCDEPQQTCAEGFFCNGENCIAALDPEEGCSNDPQCGPEHYCDESCQERLPVGEDCDTDSQCLSDLCYSFDDSRTCVNRIRLSPAEPMCAALR